MKGIHRARRPVASISAVATVLFLAAAMPAWAQDVDQEAPRERDQQTQAASGNGGDGEIVVTARRRDERLLDVPAAVTAVDAQSLENAGITSLQQLTQVAPSVLMTQGGAVPQPTIRGIGSRGVSAGDESVVPIYLRPSADPTFRGSFSLGSYGERIARGYASAGGDVIAGDIAANVSVDDGYSTNVRTGKSFGRRDNSAFRSRILFTPSSSLEAILAGSYSKSYLETASATQPIDGNTRGRNVPGTFIPTEPFEVDQNVTPTFIPGVSNKQKAISLTANYHAPSFDITSITGWERNQLHLWSDSDGTFADQSRLEYRQYSRTINQELYAVSTGSGPLGWTVGLQYFSASSGYNPRVTTPPLFSNVDTDAFAAYGELTYEFSDTISLSAGGRYTDERRAFTASQGAVSVASKDHGKRFTPTATLRFPDYSNIQVVTRDPVTAAALTQNAAKAELYGVEAEAILTPLPNFNIRGGVSLIHSQYLEFPDAQIYTPLPGNNGNVAIFADMSGKPLPKVPEASLNLSADYTVPLGSPGAITFATNVHHNSGYPWDASDRLRQGSYTLLNGVLTWSIADSGFKVSIWGQNLLDQTYQLTATSSSLADLQSFARPRTVGLKLDVEL